MTQRKKILILDACNSGAFIGKGEIRTEVCHSFIGPDYLVLTSAGAYEDSFLWHDRGTAGGSYFAQELCEGLRSGAFDPDKDGIVTLSEACTGMLECHGASGARAYPEDSRGRKAQMQHAALIFTGQLHGDILAQQYLYRPVMGQELFVDGYGGPGRAVRKIQRDLPAPDTYRAKPGHGSSRLACLDGLRAVDQRHGQIPFIGTGILHIRPVAVCQRILPKDQSHRRAFGPRHGKKQHAQQHAKYKRQKVRFFQYVILRFSGKRVLFLRDHAHGHILRALAVDRFAFGLHQNAAPRHGHILLALQRIVAGSDIQHAAADVYISLAGFVRILRLYGILAGCQRDDAVLYRNGVVTLQSVFERADGNGAGNDLQIVLAADPVIVIALYDQFPGAVDSQVVPAADAG